ncbi:MAG: 2Fe-2S iron-sulfur cluster-binding protein [bacterium]
MVKLTINNREVEVEEGATVLQAARKLGIEIPTLCYHEALAPYGACRVCLVEVATGKRSRLTTACTYPVWEGIAVRTDSERVIKARRFIIELLLARCPNVPQIRELAEKLGVKQTRFKTADKECILCGLCGRVCKEIIGSSAISFINRGIERVMETPFEIDSEVCIGCGACAFVCPTGAIKIEDIKGYRKIEIWHAQRELAKCKDCDNRFAPMATLKYLKERIELPDDFFELCSGCRRKKLGKELVNIVKSSSDSSERLE